MNHTKFQGQFYLVGHGQGHQFSNPSETFRCLINNLSRKVKFESVECLILFWKFEGQLDLEDQGQGHQFSKSYETFRLSINSLSFKIKFLKVKF